MGMEFKGSVWYIQYQMQLSDFATNFLEMKTYLFLRQVDFQNWKNMSGFLPHHEKSPIYIEAF